MAEKKHDLDYLLAQARRISAHREADAEKEIRKVYKEMLKELKQTIADAYERYGDDDRLTFAMLQKASYDARFLEEIEHQMSVATPKAAKELRSLVKETYTSAYEAMVKAVDKGMLDDVFTDDVAATPEQIKKVVHNPIMEVALERNRKDIIYDIKQAVAVGLMNGDRYTTMAHRISEKVDGAFYKSVRIARTEAHRVREAGNYDAAMDVDGALQKGTTGMRMVKTWRTMKDERVRPQRKKGKKVVMRGNANHMKMNGQIVLANELFDLGHNVKATAPGQSGDASNDINCRCYVSYTMMTDEEYFKETGKHFPENKNKPIAYVLNDKFIDVDVDTFYNALDEYYKYKGYSDTRRQEYISIFREMIEKGRYKNFTVDEVIHKVAHNDSDQQALLNFLNVGRVAGVKTTAASKAITESIVSSKWSPEDIAKARSRITKRMKTDGQLNDRQFKEFETLMSDWSDDQVMVYDSFTRTKLKKNKYRASGGAYYQPGGDFVNMDINDNTKERHLGQSWTAGWHTKFHEEFHQIDYTLFKTAKMTPRINSTAGTKAFKKAFESDIIKIAKEHTSFKGKTLAALTKDQQSMSELARYLSRTYSTTKQKAQIDLFTDGLGLITEDAFSPHRYGFWGHDSQYNKRGVNGAGKEVWASYGGCIMSNDKEQRAALDKLMPETMKLMDEWFQIVVNECR